MAQIIKHRRGTLAQLQGVTLANGEIGIVSSSAANIGDSVLKTGLVIGNTDGTNRLTFSRLPQGNATPNLSGITGGANFNDMLYHETDAKRFLVLNTGGNTTLDLTGNIANKTIGGTLDINGNFEVTGSIIGTTSINAASFGTTLASLISGSFTSISSSLASRVTAEETTPDFTDAQISGSWQGAIPAGTLTSFSGSAASTGSFGRVQATNIGGTIVTAAQPNITSVGTLGGLTVNGATVSLTDTGGDGTIDGIRIGNTTAASGKFTTIDASTNVNITGSLVLGDGNTKTFTLNAAAAGTDITVLILDGSNVVKHREIDSRVWGSTLVDINGLGNNNELVTFSDSDTIVGQANLTFNGSTLGLTGAMNISGNLSGSAASTGSFGHLIFDSGTIDGGSF